jgi:hypothetical protein
VAGTGGNPLDIATVAVVELSLPVHQQLEEPELLKQKRMLLHLVLLICGRVQERAVMVLQSAAVLCGR